MGWHGHLQLRYHRDAERTLAHDLHHGPLRVLQRLYPEGPEVCHHVLVHPPGGIVGGDVLDITVDLTEQTHALITTPGATRFYRSAGELARQSVQARVAAGARLEWLPLETIVYNAALAENHLCFTLEEDAQMIGWDMLALGLPASSEPFERGHITQHVEWPGVWLERGTLDAQDKLLLSSPVGLAGHRVMATLWAASGTAWDTPQRQALLDSARECMGASPLAAWAGATSPEDRLVVCRVLAHRVEPVFALWRQIRAAWRQVMWSREANPPRLWSL